jgi:hypothetical protein
MKSSPCPTPAQRAVLELLADGAVLTVRQIHEYLKLDCGKRALERLLVRLEAHGWVRRLAIYPERGRASEHGWLLCSTGARAIDLAPNQVRSRSDAQIRRLLTAGMPPALGSNKLAVLKLLAEWKQLTTTQIHQYLNPDRSRRYTQQLLHDLAARGFIRGVAYSTWAREEYYWMLLARGAHDAGCAYGKQYRRPPAPQTLRHRGLQLALIAQAQGAGWFLIRPGVYSAAHPRPLETPQRRKLVDAFLEIEGRTLNDLMARGVAWYELKDRMDRHQRRQVGALVPVSPNDYVAYVPYRTELAAVLIPHPSYAGLRFWTRKPAFRYRRPTFSDERDSRLERYRRLARILPVIAVFGTPEEADACASILAPAGLEVLVVEEVGPRLAQLAHPAAPAVRTPPKSLSPSVW